MGQKLTTTVGDTNEMLEVIDIVRRPDNHGSVRPYLTCKCKCGGVKSGIKPSDFRKGYTKSCGCLHKPHGKARTYEYQMFHRVKTRAYRNGLEFDLTLDDIVIPEICPLLRIKLAKGVGVMCDNSPTIDRIDSKRGYTKDNVMIISAKANRIKNDATPQELRLIADAIAYLT